MTRHISVPFEQSSDLQIYGSRASHCDHGLYTVLTPFRGPASLVARTQQRLNPRFLRFPYIFVVWRTVGEIQFDCDGAIPVSTTIPLAQGRPDCLLF
jgi:hypothetical protein